ncbi:hypothetical protein GJ629_00545 [Halapricum sp. CBA1109]|nr:hypothetical protein [Halapricum sp. CBA1109]
MRCTRVELPRDEHRDYCRLLSGTNLEVDGSALTGESAPVLNDPDWQDAENAH